MKAEIIKTWFFSSESSSRLYQTQLYADGSTSCDCRGWTMQPKRNKWGLTRSCKHTRLVHAGLADKQCDKCIVPVGVSAAAAKFAALPKPAKEEEPMQEATRSFSFD